MRCPRLVPLLLANGLAAQTVHVVGPGGFAQIQHAIAAAANGDVVVIQSGTYVPFTLAKNLTLTAAPGAIVEIYQPPLSWAAPTVLQPPTLAKVAGLRFRCLPSPFGFSETRVVSGTVHFADCAFEGWLAQQRPALLVQNANVAMQRCVVIGGGLGSLGSGSGAGGDGMAVHHATVAAVDCMFFGGNLNWDYSPANGGHGVLADDATLQLCACYAVGGSNAALTSAGVPGDGVRIVSSSQVSIADCDLRGGHCYGGPGGSGLANFTTPAARQARSVFTGGTGSSTGPAVAGQLVAAALLGVVVTPPIAIGTPWSVAYRTGPSTPVLALWSDRLSPSVLPLVAEPVWLPTNAFAVADLGVTDANGLLTFTFVVPATSALLHASYFLQAVAGLTLPLEAAAPVGGVVR